MKLCLPLRSYSCHLCVRSYFGVIYLTYSAPLMVFVIVFVADFSVSIRIYLIYIRIESHLDITLTACVASTCIKQQLYIFSPAHKSVYYRRHIIFWCKNWNHTVNLILRYTEIPNLIEIRPICNISTSYTIQFRFQSKSIQFDF